MNKVSEIATKAYVAISNKIRNLHNEVEGATAVEYGIMVAAIAAVIVTVVYAIGVKVDAAFDAVDAVMK